MIKGKILEELKGIAILYVQNKVKVEEELKIANEEAVDEQQINNYIESSNARMTDLQSKIDAMKAERFQTEQ